ncbi:MAG TPA: arginine--tRNA ligase [Candidatus Saccharimonadia bacterium]|nr:arginine--tRNA ligase [Candidatus Saccharimonadia bacterium]
MKSDIEKVVQTVCESLYGVSISSSIVRTEKKFGDFSSNIAMQLTKQLKRPPMDIAKEIIHEIEDNNIFSKLDVLKPGFINFTVKDVMLIESLKLTNDLQKFNSSKQILIEYGDPNPFKEMHLGHIYTAIIGDTLASLLESSGADVKRLCYQGDVGLHVAKAIYVVGEYMKWNLDGLEEAYASHSLGYFYASGEKAYNENETAKTKIQGINQNIYKKDNDIVNKIYDLGKKISYERFDKTFDDIGVYFDKKYFESESSKIGEKLVRDNIPKVFEKSDGAVIYRGEKDGLHTRVFINSRGFTTYDAKELGLTVLKHGDFPKADISIIITAAEQDEYFKVVLAALAKIDPKLAQKTIHLSHGFLSLTSGKMSSRTGKVFTGADLVSQVHQMVDLKYKDSKVKKEIFLAALRYTFLRQRIGIDIVFDVEQSIALEGNSGPYLQYAHARACSILAKAKNIDTKFGDKTLQSDERDLVVKICDFPDVILEATKLYLPHQICTYLFELAKEFNSFYEKNRVIDDPRMNLRLAIARSYKDVLEEGLRLLHIPSPESM